jgi:hypothetical protein
MRYVLFGLVLPLIICSYGAAISGNSLIDGVLSIGLIALGVSLAFIVGSAKGWNDRCRN